MVNAVKALKEFGYAESFKWNTLTGTIELTHTPGEPWDDKSLFAHLQMDIEMQVYENVGGAAYVPTDGALMKAVTVVAQESSYHPFLDYYNGLPEWNGTDYLKDMAWVFGQEETELNNEICCIIPRALLVKAYHPRAHVPYMPILMSPKQGAGKGETLKILSRNHHVEGLELEGFDIQKKLREKAGDAAIVEIGEVDNLGGRRMSTLKSIITDETVKVREAYARQSGLFAQRAILVGTTNRRHFLNDKELRRFPVIEIPFDFRIQTYFLRDNLDQIFAQIKAEYAAGKFAVDAPWRYEVRLAEHLWGEQQEQSEQYKAPTAVLEYIETYIDENAVPVTCFEINKHLKDTMGTTPHASTIQDAMAELGIAYYNTRNPSVNGGKRTRFWDYIKGADDDN